MGNCALMELEGHLTCRRESGGVWGTVNYGHEDIDSDPAMDATGLKSNQWLVAIGGDVTLGDYGVIGIGGGYVKNKADMDWYGGQIDSDGWQIEYHRGNYVGRFPANTGQLLQIVNI